MTGRAWNYTRKELSADAVIHVAGLVLASGGALALVVTAFMVAGFSDVAAVAVYALTLVAGLVASALYSMWPIGPTKWRLRKYDYAAIYLLIAGTYTPFAVSLGDRGLWLLGSIWSMATAGILLKLVFPNRFKRFSVLLYLGLAWSGAMIFNTLFESFPAHVFGLLLAGGLVYSAGVPFHLWQSLPFHKAIWHAFVLTAATIHYAAVFSLLLA
ncbi:hemolysin III family protein [Tianweitania sp. BSSL-BM11]|uniref:Hemolysin III family protein n=1 Tax=Tianweitania aestuarii TaxID=2814886 RepID=A0ABS5RRU5_9HYPH|nr:hemolysin III family protein [Tianweitania aestuarii]